MRSVKIGCPGFILREYFADDFEGGIQKIGAMGYDGIEITGFFGRDAKTIRTICEKNGLEVFGCYALTPNMLCQPIPPEMAAWDDLLQIMTIPAKTPDEVMAYIKALGAEYIGLCMTNDHPTEKTFADIAAVNELAQRHGLKLQYHNHNWEYFNMVNGEYRMDHVLKNIPDSVRFEPDLGWMAIGGYDPMKALKKYKDRIEIVHLKDYYRPGSDILDVTAPFEFRPTGYGVLDWSSLISYCEQEIKPKWYVADHDMAVRGTIFEELDASLKYIREALKYCQADDLSKLK